MNENPRFRTIKIQASIMGGDWGCDYGFLGVVDTGSQETTLICLAYFPDDSPGGSANHDS